MMLMQFLLFLLLPLLPLLLFMLLLPLVLLSLLTAERRCESLALLLKLNPSFFEVSLLINQRPPLFHGLLLNGEVLGEHLVSEVSILHKDVRRELVSLGLLVELSIGLVELCQSRRKHTRGGLLGECEGSGGGGGGVEGGGRGGWKRVGGERCRGREE